MKSIALVLGAVVVLGGGTVFMAERSLPGDALYSMKVNLNEMVVAALKGRGEARGMWHVGIINERLHEAVTLAGQGKLTAEAAAELTTNFDYQTGTVAGIISELEAAGNSAAATKVATDLTRVLAENAGVIASLRMQADATFNAESMASLTALTAKINSTLTAAAMIATRASTEAGSTSTQNSPETKDGSGASIDVEVNADGTVDIEQ